MTAIYNKIGVVDSFYPEFVKNGQGACLLWVNDKGETEKVTFDLHKLLVEGRPVEGPIRDWVALGERVSFDAVPNTLRNSWNVTWRATAVRKLPSEDARRASSGAAAYTARRGRVLHVEATAAVIGFQLNDKDEFCAFVLGAESMVNGVQVVNGLDDFLAKYTEIDFAPFPVASKMVVGSTKRYACAWSVNSIFAEDVSVPASHEAPKLADTWLRASVVSVTDRRAILSFKRPDTGDRAQALLIAIKFSPPTDNLNNVLKFRDEVEFMCTPHAHPRNADGCAFFATRARHVPKAARGVSAPAPAAVVTNGAAAAPQPKPRPAVKVANGITNADSFLEAVTKDSGEDEFADGSGSWGRSSPGSGSASASASADELLVNLLRTSKLTFIWEHADLVRSWLEDHPSYADCVQQIIVDKYAAGEATAAAVVAQLTD